MNYLLHKIYQISIKIFEFLILLASFWHPKAKLWLEGRKGIFKKLRTAFQNPSSPVIWVHCASLGEFEQARPLIEIFKIDYPNYKILISFFSPSGFEIRKNFSLADFVFYLPLDTSKNAKQFLNIVQPKLVLFVKYEFWNFYLEELQVRQIPTFLISGVFRKNQWFFKWYGRWFLPRIKGFDHIFLQDNFSLEILKSFGIENGSVVGDTRIDRVIAIKNKQEELPIIEQFKGNKKLLILGSSHAKEEQLIFDLINAIKEKDYLDDWKFLIAPHEIDDPNIARIMAKSPIPAFRYADKRKFDDFTKFNILIMDTIGHLSSAFLYGTLVFIGGGFDKGIHNILEPAVYGKPIIFGPNYQNFKEAKDLIARKGAISVASLEDLKTSFAWLQIEDNLLIMGTKCHHYITKNKGATKKILCYFKNKNII